VLLLERTNEWNKGRKEDKNKETNRKKERWAYIEHPV
jgi:hypothetical protein